MCQRENDDVHQPLYRRTFYKNENIQNKNKKDIKEAKKIKIVNNQILHNNTQHDGTTTRENMIKGRRMRTF